MWPLKTKKRIIILMFIFIGFFSGALVNLSAVDYGLGVLIGQPTGISFKINNFPVGAIAWGFDRFIQAHIDYWFFSRMIREPAWWYLGFGGKVRFNMGSDSEEEPVQLGVRIPVGLQLIFEQAYEAFVEIAPGIKLWEGTTFALDGSIGFRFHFPTGK